MLDLVFFRADKSGMTYVIFKGTKTAQKTSMRLFSADSREDNPHLTDSDNFFNVTRNRTRVSFSPVSFFSWLLGREPVTSHAASQLRPDYC